MTIGKGGAEACSAVMSRFRCDKKFISMVSYPLPNPQPAHFELLWTISYFISWNVRCWVMSRIRRIESKFVFSSSMAYNDISKALYERYLPEALVAGKLVSAPEPQVVGHGLDKVLDKVQEAFDAQKGVSARKLVVTL